MANQTEIIDVYLRRQAWLDRYAASQISEYVKRLERMRDRAVKRMEMLAKTRGQVGAFSRHVNALDEIIREGAAAMKDEFEKGLTSLTTVEASAEASAVSAAWPAAAASTAVIPEYRTPAAVLGVARQSFDKVDATARRYLRGIVAEAVNTGIPTRDAVLMAQAGAGRYFDGMARSHLSTIIRSGIMSVSASIRDQTMQQNASVVETVFWLSTLDNRTTIHCAVRDGLPYSLPDYLPIDHSQLWGDGPGAAHYNCRSTFVPGFGETQMQGMRAGRDYRQTDRRGRPGKGRQFRATTNFQRWFDTQPTWFKRDYLGPTRYALYREGVPLGGFAAARPGNLLTIAELRGKYAEIFDRLN